MKLVSDVLVCKSAGQQPLGVVGGFVTSVLIHALVHRMTRDRARLMLILASFEHLG